MTSAAASAPIAPAIPQSSATRRGFGADPTIGGRLRGTSSGITSTLASQAAAPARGTTCAMPVRICSSVLTTSFCSSSIVGSLRLGRMLTL